MLIKFSAIFFVFGFLGWVLELIYRRLVSQHKWMNPGFLTGPFLPLYGFGMIGLYGFTLLLNKINIDSVILKSIIIIFILSVVVITIEFITGLIFIRCLHIKLWDYSDRKGNILGVICPLYSLFWVIISAIYYLFAHNFIANLVDNISNNYYIYLAVGIALGIIICDFSYSFHIATRISKFAKDAKITVGFEKFKAIINKNMAKLKEKIFSLTIFKNDKNENDNNNKDDLM